MATVDELRTLVTAHWSAMKKPKSSAMPRLSFLRIRAAVEEIGDVDAIAFLRGDNYAIVDEGNPNFGLSGLPVVVFLSQKYGFPLDSGYQALKQKHLAKCRKMIAESKKQLGEMLHQKS